MTDINEQSVNKTPPVILTREAEELISNYLEEISTTLMNSEVSPEEIEKTVNELSNHIKELCALKSKGKVVTTDTVEKILKKLGPPKELNLHSFSNLTSLATESSIQNNSSNQTIQSIKPNETRKTENITAHEPILRSITPLELTIDYFNTLSKIIFLFSFVFIFPFLLVIIPDDSYYFFNNWGNYFGFVISIQSILIIIYIVSLFLFYLSPIKKVAPRIIPQKGSYFAYTFFIQFLFIIIDDFYFEIRDSLYYLVYYVFLFLSLFVLFVGIIEIINNILEVRNSKISSS